MSEKCPNCGSGEKRRCNDGYLVFSCEMWKDGDDVGQSLYCLEAENADLRKQLAEVRKAALLDAVEGLAEIDTAVPGLTWTGAINQLRRMAEEQP